MVYRVKHIRNGVETPMQIGCSNSRGPITTAFYTPEVQDLGALQAAIIQQSGAMLPDGMSLFTTFLSYTYIQEDLIYKAQQASFGLTHFFLFSNFEVNDILEFNNGSYIKVVEKLGNGQAAGDSAVLRLEYRTKDDYLAYKCQVYASSNSLGYGYELDSFPMLFSPDNPGNYTINSFKIEYNTRLGTRAFVATATSAGYYGGIVPPVSAALGEAFWTGITPADTDNPYDGAGASDTGGGDPDSQNFDDESDSVEEDAMPSLSAVGTGMATIFKPNRSQLKYLAEVFWGSQWWTALQNTVEGIDKMFVSLGIVPFIVTPGATVEVTWLGLAFTEIFLTLAAQQYYEFDMGSIDLANDSRIYTSDSAMDYSPFSKLGIYLPFIGYQELDIDEFRGKVVKLVYRIDILSGTCVALIKTDGNTLYQFTGNCMTQIPITSQSFENMITNAVNVGIAVSGVRSASAVGTAANGVAEELADKGKISEKQETLTKTKSRVHVEGAIDRLLSAGANSIMGLKPNYDKSGAVSNSASLLAVKQPFLFLTTPRICVPEHYQRYSGFPSNITAKIGDCSGYLVVESIRLNGLVATSSEVEEIYELLKSGVIV